MRRLSTTAVKVVATVEVFSLSSSGIDDDTAFMVLIARKHNAKNTNVRWPSKGIVKFDDKLTLDVTLYRGRNGFQSKTFELQVRLNLHQPSLWHHRR